MTHLKLHRIDKATISSMYRERGPWSSLRQAVEMHRDDNEIVLEGLPQIQLLDSADYNTGFQLILWLN